MHEEIELKLALPRQTLPVLRCHPLIAPAEVSMSNTVLENTYYDTADLALMKERVGLRTRRAGTRYLQTVKCAATSTGGLSRRPEWEQTFDGKFDFSAIDEPKLRTMLEGLHPRLEPLFTTRFERETRVYAPNADTRIEIMIDTGHILAGDRSEPLCEVELELVHGSPNALLELAIQLAKTLPLIPHDASKAQRGYALSQERPLQARRASPIICARDTTPLAAFRELAFECLAQWQYNTWGAATHGEPEFTHQARVALRRLRTLFKAFAPALPKQLTEHWQTALKEQSTLFAATRNLDVIIDDVLPTVSPPLDSCDATAHTQLIQSLANARQRARRTAQRRLATSPGPGEAQLTLTQTLHQLDVTSTARDKLLHYAPVQLDRLHRRLCKRLAKATPNDAARLHGLRIAIKELRYALDQLAPSLPLKKKALAPYLNALGQAQTQLGHVNDMSMLSDAPELTRLSKRNASHRQAWAYARGWLNATMHENIEDILKGIERTSGHPPPWAVTKRARA